MSERYVWEPTDEYVQRANVTRLAQRHGIGSIDELRAASVADISWFWGAVVEDLSIPFRVPFQQVVDLSAGLAHAEWFVGGRTNVVDACLTRWLEDPHVADAPAVIHESEAGETQQVTYRELAAMVEAASAGLARLDIGMGDPVGLFMPMIPEAVAAFYAIARRGAVVVPLFSGFAASAIAARLEDAGARAVIAADGTTRRGRVIDMKGTLDAAVAECPFVRHVVVVPCLGRQLEPASDRELAWDELLSRPDGSEAEDTGASDVLLLAYTSGTSGRPKGAVHTHAGFLVKVASEVAYSFDVHPTDVACWFSDMGWLTGPLATVGTHANGGSLVLYDGAPNVPDVGRIWQIASRHSIRTLGITPTLIRTLRAGNEDAPLPDLSSVRLVCSTGEPWDPTSYAWLAQDVFGGRVPIVNFSGGTEVGGSFLAPYPIEPIPACSLGGPSLGMDVDVVGPDGHPVRGSVGELICRQPWPSMTRGLWHDEQRYLETYWETFEGVWRQGDWALVDDDGTWYLLGRSDDVMNIAGKRLAPAEVESVIIEHPAVVEVAAVGVPDELKGEAIWCFWVGSELVVDDDEVSEEVADRVANALGRPFHPALVRRVAALPKTRSAKVLRRAIRAAAIGDDPGDLSSAENPEALGGVRDAVER